MAEDALVAQALDTLQRSLKPPLIVQRGAALLYRITVDHELTVAVNPKAPARGQSAFQTDLCVFERRRAGTETPRVVLEFKAGLTTHDVLTYSAKAQKHKHVYPYLRYGVVVSRERFLAGRFFMHNDALDFCVALAGLPMRSLSRVLTALVRAEVRASRRLQRIASERLNANLFRSDIQLKSIR